MLFAGSNLRKMRKFVNYENNLGMQPFKNFMIFKSFVDLA